MSKAIHTIQSSDKNESDAWTYYEDGLNTEYYANGQKKWERTYKDDILISEKLWDVYGNII